MEPIGWRVRQPAPFLVLEGPQGQVVERHPRLFGSNVLLVVLHGPGCPSCIRIARELGEHRRTWEAWGARVVVLHASFEPFRELPLPQERDPDGATRRRYGGPEADAVIVCLGHGGTYMEGWRVRHPEAIDWDEVAQTVRWVAVQEPECATCTIDPVWEDM